MAPNLSRRNVFVLLCTLLLASVVVGTATRAAPPDEALLPTPIATPSPIRMMFDYRDGVQKSFTNLAFTKGMTVFDALKLAQDHPRGVTFKSTGSGETAFITQIDDLKNQGGGKTALNWQYRINTKIGTRGVGASILEPGDQVLWEFDVYKMPSSDK